MPGLHSRPMSVTATCELGNLPAYALRVLTLMFEFLQLVYQSRPHVFGPALPFFRCSVEPSCNRGVRLSACAHVRLFAPMMAELLAQAVGMSEYSCCCALACKQHNTTTCSRFFWTFSADCFLSAQRQRHGAGLRWPMERPRHHGRQEQPANINPEMLADELAGSGLHRWSCAQRALMLSVWHVYHSVQPWQPLAAA